MPGVIVKVGWPAKVPDCVRPPIASPSGTEPVVDPVVESLVACPSPPVPTVGVVSVVGVVTTGGSIVGNAPPYNLYKSSI